jgi:hypothetical protein
VTGTSQTVQITSAHVGPNTITLTGLSPAGNPSAADTETFNVLPPDNAHAYTDGDINGDGNADLLAVGATTTQNPGLWLATGNGSGSLTTPTDIGGLGTALNTGGAAPGDWNGAQALHGDFTQDHVQDVVAYYPPGSAHPGSLQLMPGNGRTDPLDPANPKQAGLTSGSLQDPKGNYPLQLVAAGHAGLTTTNVNPPDLVGITGDGNSGYILNLYSANDFGSYAGVTYPGMSATVMVLASASQSPDGATDWNNFALATAQPGGDPTKTVLFALNKTTGKLWESINTTGTTSTPIGSGYGTPTTTWTPIDTSNAWTTWSGSNTLAGADINHVGGSIELWVEKGLKATSYTLNGSSLAAGTSTNLLAPAHSWPLSDGGSAQSAVDTAGAIPATFSTKGVTWSQPTNDHIHATVASFDGTGYLNLPQKMISSMSAMSLTLEFQAKPGSNGVLFSTGSGNPDATLPNSGAMPIMYIGTDGRLYAQFWNGVINPMISPQPVNDGQWHRATLTSTGNHQGLYLDANIRIGMEGSNTVTDPNPLVFAGGGTFNTAAWINPPGDKSKVRSSYFQGQLADVSFYTTTLYGSELDPLWQPQTMTGPIRSGLSNTTANYCVDNNGGATTNGNHIQIWGCSTYDNPNQRWSLNPDGTITAPAAGNKCMGVGGDHLSHGSPIMLWDCISGSTSQQWHLDSSGQIWNPQSGMCLADPSSSTTNGTQLIIWDCDLGKEQYWIDP